jgi:hypothetical protein
LGRKRAIPRVRARIRDDLDRLRTFAGDAARIELLETISDKVGMGEFFRTVPEESP